MTDYYNYSPNPIVLNNGSTFQLTYNAFEILRPVGTFNLYNSSNVLMSTFQPIAPFITGYGLYNPISIDFDNSGNMYALCDISSLPNVSNTLSTVIVKRDYSTNDTKDIIHTISTTPATSLAIDNKNYIYVCFRDTNQGFIVKYDSSGNEIFSSNGIDHFLHALPQPTSVTFDTSNNLYIILDSNTYGTMVKYDPSGNQIVSFTSPNNTNNFKILFACYNNSYLYVCFSENNSNKLFHIHKFTTDGIYVADIYTTSNINLTAGILMTDNSQNLYFTNYYTDNTTGKYGTGKFTNININSPYTAINYDVSNSFYYSSFLSAIGYNPVNASFYTTNNKDQSNNLIKYNTYLSNTVINNLTLNNTNSTVTTSVYYDASIKPNYPQYLVFDSNNNVFYVTDIASLNVLKVVSGQSTPFILQLDIQKACYNNNNQHIVTAISGIVLYNNYFYISATCKNGNGISDIIILTCSISSPSIITILPVATNITIPQGIAMDLSGQNLYLSGTIVKLNGKTDTNIFKYNIASGTTTSVSVKTNSDNNNFYGLAFDLSGNLYAALNKGKNVDGTIMKYNSDFSVSQIYTSSYLDINNNVQNITNPLCIVFDNVDNLYISCTDPSGNGIVIQNNLINQTTTLFAQSSDALVYPVGIALNNIAGFPTGDLYIACQNSHSIVKAYTHNIIFTDIPTTDLSLGVNYLRINDPYNLIDISVNAINLSPCFGENSQILTYCQQDNLEKYKKICKLRAGDLVKTYEHGYVPIELIGFSEINHPSNQKERIRQQLYVCSPNQYPEIFEDLILTGCHSILIDMFKSEQEYIDTRKVNNGRLFATDNKFRLPACVDERAIVYDKPGTYTIYHLALKNTDPLMNYGIYANGLLVETCSIRFMKKYANMKMIN